MTDHDPLRYLRDGTLYTFQCVPELEALTPYDYQIFGTRTTWIGRRTIWTKSAADFKRVLAWFNLTHETFVFKEINEQSPALSGELTA